MGSLGLEVSGTELSTGGSAISEDKTEDEDDEEEEEEDEREKEGKEEAKVVEAEAEEEGGPRLFCGVFRRVLLSVEHFAAENGVGVCACSAS